MSIFDKCKGVANDYPTESGMSPAWEEWRRSHPWQFNGNEYLGNIPNPEPRNKMADYRQSEDNYISDYDKQEASSAGVPIEVYMHAKRLVQNKEPEESIISKIAQMLSMNK